MRDGKVIGRFINKNTSLYCAQTAQRFMLPYIPASVAIAMSRNVTFSAKKDTGIISYNSPYAHFQYMGELYVSPTTGSPWARMGETKVPTGVPLKYDKLQHPNATDHWDKAMMVAKKKDFLKSIQAYMERM